MVTERKGCGMAHAVNGGFSHACGHCARANGNGSPDPEWKTLMEELCEGRIPEGMTFASSFDSEPDMDLGLAAKRTARLFGFASDLAAAPVFTDGPINPNLRERIDLSKYLTGQLISNTHGELCRCVGTSFTVSSVLGELQAMGIGNVEWAGNGEVIRNNETTDPATVGDIREVRSVAEIGPIRMEDWPTLGPAFTESGAPIAYRIPLLPGVQPALLVKV